MKSLTALFLAIFIAIFLSRKPQVGEFNIQDYQIDTTLVTPSRTMSLELIKSRNRVEVLQDKIKANITYLKHHEIK